MDDGEAPDWNDAEIGKMWQWSRIWRGVGNLTGLGARWAYTRQRSRVGRCGLCGSTAAVHGTQEQEQRLKKEHGYWINIQRSSC